MKTGLVIAFCLACIGIVGAEEAFPEPPPLPDPTIVYTPDVYGPGIGSDQYGRPVSPTPGDGTTQVAPDTYGPGIGSDQYGRPVTTQPED